MSGGTPVWLRASLVLVLLLLVLALGATGLYARYHSWHPCDWLLQDRVATVLREQGIDPDTASVVQRAIAVESPEVQAVRRLRSTAASCFATWAAGRVAP